MSIRDMEDRKKRFMANVNKNWESSFKKEETQQERKSQYQDLYWSYKIGADNSARVKMRLLPDAKGNTFVEEYMYFWRNTKNNRSYNAKCRDFLGKKDDPMTNYKNGLWKEDRDNEKAGRPTFYGKESGIRKSKRLVTNVYIIDDENQPENNGKVFLWNMPETFYNIVKNKSGFESTQSSFGDDDIPSEKINPYDPFSDGANLILEVFKSQRGKEFSAIDYSKTRFVRNKGPLFEDEDDIFDTLEKCHNLDEINTESKCQPVDVLQKRLDYALGHIELNELQEYLDNRKNTYSEAPKRPVEPKSAPLVSFDDDDKEDAVQANIDRFNDAVEDAVSITKNPPVSIKFDVDDDDDFDPEKLLAKARASKGNIDMSSDDIPF